MGKISKGKKAKVLICVALIFGFLSMTCSANTWTLVNFPRYEQEHDAWCWAACVRMLTSFYGYNLSQSSIVVSAFGVSPPSIYATANQIETARPISNLTSLSTIKGNASPPLTEAAVKTKITSGYPIIAGVSGAGWKGYDYFHAFVIDQYSDTTHEVRLVDPWYGKSTRRTYSYDDLANYTVNIDFWGIGYWFWYVSLT